MNRFDEILINCFLYHYRAILEMLLKSVHNFCRGNVTNRHVKVGNQLPWLRFALSQCISSISNKFTHLPVREPELRRCQSTSPLPDVLSKPKALHDRQHGRHKEHGRTLYHVIIQDTTTTLSQHSVHLT